MAPGFGGTYRATVVDDIDPLMQNRLLVLVPDVHGSESAWAMPSLASAAASVPAVGTEVFVPYEHADSDYPVWHTVDSAGVPPAGPYAGMYRATVIDNIDPMQSNRVLIAVPDVGLQSAWANRSTSLSAGSDVPAVGAAVWVQFEHGDPNYPVWVGLA